MFMSGDNAAAKDDIKSLVDSVGFAPVDLGSITSGGRVQQAGGPLSGQNLVLLD